MALYNSGGLLALNKIDWKTQIDIWNAVDFKIFGWN